MASSLRFIALLLIEHSQSQLIGSWGQNCALGIDDPLPTVCPQPGVIKTDGGGGKIECGGNFDCCLCQSMICGSSTTNGSSPCIALNCNGDSGCFGVRDIQVYGSEQDGATISCNGDESCNSTQITGSNIKELICSGDGACARSTFIFDCLQQSPCPIGCGGNAACAGQLQSDETDLTTLFTIGNTAGIECSSSACKYGTFTMLSNIGGGSIMCTGVDACLEAEITINNIEGIICGGTNACKHASFLVVDPQQDFSVECSAPSSCEGIKLEIVVNNGIDFFKGIGCGGSACIDAEISIINNGDQYISIENLQCSAPSSCQNAKFDFDGGLGGIGFEHCLCGELSTMACDGIIGIDSCLSGLETLSCSGIGSCSDLQQQVTNVANGFELLCDDDSSCKGFWLMILLNNNGRSDTTQLNGYACNADEACQGAIIQLNNEQSGDITVTINRIVCNGISACQDTKFIIVGKVEIEQIICDASSSCANCVVQDSLANTITPCVAFIGLD